MRFPEANDVPFRACDRSDFFVTTQRFSGGIHPNVASIVTVSGDKAAPVSELNASMNRIFSRAWGTPGQAVVDGNSVPCARKFLRAFVFGLFQVAGPGADKGILVGGVRKGQVVFRFSKHRPVMSKQAAVVQHGDAGLAVIERCVVDDGRRNPGFAVIG